MGPEGFFKGFPEDDVILICREWTSCVYKGSKDAMVVPRPDEVI